MPRKTKRHTVSEILEGGDQEEMQDADEAMDEYPFELDGDGADAREAGLLIPRCIRLLGQD